MNRSALVTGATGFVGSHLVRHLLTAGWGVCAAVRSTSQVERLPVGHPALQVSTVDGTAGGFREALLHAQVDVVFHLAAEFVSDHTAEDIEDLVATNVGLGTQLLQGMVEADVRRVVTTSTVWCRHGELDDQPVNLYAATKAAFDPILGYYSAAHDISTVMLELGDNYGPDDHRGKVVTALIDAVRDGRRLQMSPGDQALDLTYIDDVVEALRVAAERLALSTQTKHERFSVLSGQTISLRELAEEIQRLIGHDLDVSWGARSHRPRQVMRPRPTADALPGWLPSIRLDAGLLRLIAESAEGGELGRPGS